MTTTEPAGDLISLGELADEVGLSLSAVSRRVSKFERLGMLTVTKDGKRRIVSRTGYSDADDRATDGMRRLSGKQRVPGAAKGVGETDVLIDAQARRVAAQAALAELALSRKRGELLPVAEVQAAMAEAGRIQARCIDGLEHKTEDFAAALERDGMHGLRRALKETARELRQKIADALHAMSGEDGETGI